MNRYDFYDNLNEYKKNKNELQHSSNYGKEYINKIDNYYSDGSARYFYTQAEWDAYLEGQKRKQYEDSVAKKNKALEQNNMQGYNTWKKEQSKKTNIDKSSNAAMAAQIEGALRTKIDEEKKKIEKQKKEIIEKNKSASEHEGDRFKKPTKSLAEQAIAGREAAIKKAQKNNSNNKLKDIANKLYEHKDEIIEKADVYLKLADNKLSSFLNKFVEDFPPEFKDKVKKIINEIKDYAEDIIKKIDDTGSEQLDNIVGLIDKIADKLQDKIDEYSKELSDMYQNFKDKINPVFKDKDGNINWKLYLPIAAGVGAIGFIIENPEACFEIFSKIYDTGKKAFNFIDEKTNGKFSAALKELPKQIDKYIAYKNFEKKGFGTFTVDDGKGGRMTYLDKAYNDYLKATDGYGFSTILTDILFK